MTWAKGPNLNLEDLDCNLIDKDVVLRFIEYETFYYINVIPNKFKTDKDVIKAILNMKQFYINPVEWMDEELKKNKELIMELRKEDLITSDQLKWMDEELKKIKNLSWN